MGRRRIALLILAALALLVILSTERARRRGPSGRPEAPPGAEPNDAPPDPVDAPAEQEEAESAPPSPDRGRQKDQSGTAGAKVGVLVRVLAGGRPAAGADVRAVPMVSPGRPRPEGALAGRTDEKGEVRFTLPRGIEVRLGARRGNFVANAVNLYPSRSAEALELQLQEVLELTGLILDQDGRPVPGAEVILSLAGPFYRSRSFANALRVFSDERGRVPIRRGAVGEHPCCRVRAPGCRTVWVELAREDLLRRGFEIVVERLAVVRGRFVDGEGRPVGGVDVFLRESMVIGVSGKDGRFELQGLPAGGGTLFATPDQHGQLLRKDLRPVQGGLDLGDVELREGRSIRGTVRYEDRTPAPAVVVTAYCSTTGLIGRSAVVDAGGSFTIPRLGEGPYDLRARDTFRLRPGLSDAKVRRSGVRLGDDPVELVLRRRASLRLRFADPATGERTWVLRAGVAARHPASGAVLNRDLASSRMRLRYEATIDLEREGTWHLTVTVPGAPDHCRKVTLGPGESKLVEIPLRRGR